MIQVYDLATDVEEKAIESFYVVTKEEIDHTPKQNVLIIIRDQNAKLRKKLKQNTLRKLGLGAQNEAGEWLI